MSASLHTLSQTTCQKTVQHSGKHIYLRRYQYHINSVHEALVHKKIMSSHILQRTSQAQISHQSHNSHDRMKKYTHSGHLLLPLVISRQTDCSSIRVAITAVRHNKLLSRLWHKAELRATNHASYLKAKLGAGSLSCSQWKKPVYIPALIGSWK